MIVEMESPKKRGRPKKVRNSFSEVARQFIDRPNGFAGIQSMELPPKGKIKKEKTPKTVSYIVIDHPKGGEKVNPHHYTVRIGADGGKDVEISTDDQEWKSCRHTAGYYWYDWHTIAPGNHKCAARMCLPSGKYKKSKIVRFQVG